MEFFICFEKKMDLFITVGLYHTDLAPFWPNFDFMTSQGLPNFQILEK